MDDKQNLKLRVKGQTDKAQSSKLSDTDISQPLAVPVGKLHKEAEPGRVEKREAVVAPEVKEWVTEIKKEEAIKLPVPVKDEYGQILMESARPSKPKITIPLDDSQMQGGMKKKFSDSIRWLTTWCIRLIKKFPERVFYKTK